ncbi:CocE/NonD family hydrolase C-terminal non-catalytic domain-containing protein [Kitasatospora brasiliensis]|uniref:CocE/NonD family hydrolase C-terminal non-catalytic domain-containing protein n=1 Tax=Kitasatospora brasiliensis TaxID=3058040 RepID=UPI00292DEB2D|nr:CocE/NonD family hydrolase C-terminal non-catalytic domain-containing protein [Kitasatospora sp. K002]
MASISGEPIPAITEATLADIAEHGLWGPGATVNHSVVDLGNALVAAAQGEAVQLPPELAELVAKVRQRSEIEVSALTVEENVNLSVFTIKLSGNEPRPVVIMPAGWNPMGWLPFVYAYYKLALRGYHVLAYTPRGLGYPKWISTSTGHVNVAGPADWSDGSKVITFAEGHFSPSKIGFLGLSYGSGISQLVAAHDPDDRVAAVAAVSTWGNLATSLYANDTRHVQAVDLLVGFTGGPRDEKFDADTVEILRKFDENRDLEDVIAWGNERSPETYLAETNRRGIPTFFSNTWHETLFPALPVIDLFNRLDVPKHLNMWIGDHGAPEGAGLTGLPSSLPYPGIKDPVEEIYSFLDHYLLGVENGVPERPQVVNQVMFTYKTKPALGGKQRIVEAARREEYASWADVTTGSETWYLTGANGDGDGALADKQAAGWSRSFTVGETKAVAVEEIMGTGQDEWTGNPLRYVLGEFERDRLLVWSTDPLTGQGGVARRIRGAAKVRVTARSTSDAATLIAYLFDVAPDGNARIITHEPYTVTGVTPGADTTVEWELQPVAYDVQAGHRVALVVNGFDPLYFPGNVKQVLLPPITTTVSSASGKESRLELPLG